MLATGFFACNGPKENLPNTGDLYFDVTGYFKKESERLNRQHHELIKTVSVNGVSEQKTVFVKDWTKEFGIFFDADINKNSWRGSFAVHKASGIEIYSSQLKKIPIKKITVIRAGNLVKKVEVVVEARNILYQSLDTLIYYPDSLYSISKKQKIRFLDEKKYRITGKMK
ncbi:hypothetical protein OQ268_08685 [Pedobacter sandarakinus]|nr:hypothetical protein [Pedobacter sandarakinus]